MERKQPYIELGLHVLFWVFYFASINVEWRTDWLDPSIRPRTPAPLSVLIFPLYFYANAFFLIPSYFNKKRWPYYLLFSMLIFLLPEAIRIWAYGTLNHSLSFSEALFSRDSFLFGAPSPFFLALNLSFIYRLTRDRFLSKKQPSPSQPAPSPTTPYADVQLLSQAEATHLRSQLEYHLEEEKAYLDSNLTLRALAGRTGTTEKKLSYLLNQVIQSSFYDYINHYRVEEFKAQVKQAQNQSLSILGIALNCGFSSKSSFYRAFKAKMGISPSQYLDQERQSQ